MSVLTAVRRWFTPAGLESGGARTPRSRVRLPSAHDVPADVLRALWALDPRLDAYIHPDGRVWLLLHEENRGRIAEGRKILEQEKQQGHDECRYPFVTARLMADGWSLLDEVPYHRMTAGILERIAQQALYRSEADRRARDAELRLTADSTRQAERRAETIRERIRAEARSDWKWAYRGRRHFTSRSA